MLLVRKLALALMLGVFAVFAVHGYLTLRREVAVFEADMRRDHHLMGRALSVAVAQVWRTHGEAQALALVAAANDREAEVEFRWIWLDPAVESAGLLPDERDRIARGEEVVRLDRSSGRLDTYIPVPRPGAQRGALEVSEALEPERARFVRTTIINTVIATVAVAAVCGGVAAVAGVWFVGRPVRSLVEKARRVGSGDFTAPLDVRQRDEIGQLASEMNSMAERLAEAHKRIAAETTARIQALEQLRHADRLTTVGRLASGIAHELGTPLNVVAGRAKMIAVGEVTGKEIRDNARVIVEQAERITKIIRELLDFARPRGPHMAACDLGQIATRTLVLLEPLAEKRRVTLELAAPEGPAAANVDAGQIQQALTNLVVNGIQAMPRGGTITVGLRCQRVRPPADHGGVEAEYFCLFVCDRGEGIPSDVLPRIFEPFFTTKEVGEGTGLGLSVAYGIVQEHGGWIAVESGRGRGSCFSIYLPPLGSA